MQSNILDFFTGFSAYLQDHGFPVSESELMRLLRSISETELDITSEQEILPAISVCFAKTKEQSELIGPLFQEYIKRLLIPKTKTEKQNQKEDRKKAFEAFSNDKQCEIDALMAEKEQIRQDIIKSHVGDTRKPVAKKVIQQAEKLNQKKMKGMPYVTLKQFLKSGSVGISKEKLTNLSSALLKQAEDDLFYGRLESAQAAMAISKEVEQRIQSQEKAETSLKTEIQAAQKQVNEKIIVLQNRIKYERIRYQEACREIDAALRQMQNGTNDDEDRLIVKSYSTVHRTEFRGGGSVQMLDPEFQKIIKKPFKQLNPQDKSVVRDYLRQNLLAFETRMIRNIDSKRRLSLNMEETLREAIRTCGRPMNLIYEFPRRNKASLVLILDISGSCSAASELMLTFIGILKEIFPRGCSAFAFVNQLYDISKVYETADIDSSVQEILSMIPRAGQYSNYEVPLRTMWETYRNRITKDSMVIFIGDARNNKNDAGTEYMKNICRKAKCAYWLNTDMKGKWDHGDSIASVYGRYAKMYEAVNIQELLGFISEMR